MEENSIQDTGEITEWRAYFTQSNCKIYLQVWRLVKESLEGETFNLVGQTQVKSVQGLHKVPLYSAAIPVSPGDYIGFYFPDLNCIPFSTVECYWGKQRLRYVLDPDEGDVDVGNAFTLQVAPLNMDPCRQYSVQAIIGKCTYA